MFMSYPEVIHMTLSKSVLCNIMHINYFHMFLFEALNLWNEISRLYVFVVIRTLTSNKSPGFT